MSGFHKKEKERETPWNTINEVPTLKKRIFWSGMTLQKFSYLVFFIRWWIPTIQWKFFFNFLQSETAGTIWLFKPKHRKNCSDWLHILLFFTCFVLVNFQKFVVIQNLHCLLFQVSNATNHPNQNCLPAERNLVTWRNITSWLCILLFPSRQQGSSWCNLSNNLFNT